MLAAIFWANKYLRARWPLKCKTAFWNNNVDAAKWVLPLQFLVAKGPKRLLENTHTHTLSSTDRESEREREQLLRQKQSFSAKRNAAISIFNSFALLCFFSWCCLSQSDFSSIVYNCLFLPTAAKRLFSNRSEKNGIEENWKLKVGFSSSSFFLFLHSETLT